MTGSRAPIAAATVVAAIAVTLVALTLRQPDAATYTPTTAAPGDDGRALVGPVLYTVDATAADAWRNFSFRLGAVVDGRGDLAFKRYAIVVGRVRVACVLLTPSRICCSACSASCSAGRWTAGTRWLS